MNDNDLGEGYLLQNQRDETETSLAWLASVGGGQAQAAPAGAQPSGEQPQQGQVGGGVLGTVGATMLQGVQGAYNAYRESPRALSRGVLGPLNELGDWMSRSVPVPQTGLDTLDTVLNYKPLEGMKLMPDKPESVGGQGIESVGRFLFGFIPAMRVLRGMGMGAGTASVLGGGISEALTKDPSEQNLSALIQSYPALQNPVNEFLAGNPDDPETIKRLKNGIEGMGFGAATEGLVLGIRSVAALRRARAERQQLAETPPAAMAQPQEAPLVTPKAAIEPEAAPVRNFNEVKPEEFVAARDTGSKREAFLSPSTADELASSGTKTYTNSERTVGYAIDKDGDLQNVFNNGGPPGAARQAVEEAVANGARTLDAFDEFLPRYYSQFGFKEVGRMKFNDEFAPPGWNFERDGRPDVVFMARTGEEVTQHVPTTNYFDSYDAAKQAARDAAPPVPAGTGVPRQVVPGGAIEPTAGQSGTGTGAGAGGTPGVAGRLQQSAEVTDLGGVPGAVAARGVTGAAEEATARSQAAGRFVGARPGAEEGVYVNWGRIHAGDDILSLIDETAKAFRPQIKEAQRGVQSHAATKALADSMGLRIEDVLARPTGAAMNAETATAARMLHADLTDYTAELARAAAAPNAGPVDFYNFRRAMAVHQAFQAQVFGARTETARALNAWAIPIGSERGEMLGRQIQQLLDMHGGNATAQQMARMVADLAATNPGGLQVAMRRGWLATSVDMFREAWIVGKLWRPSTHIVNTLSNTVVAGMQSAERGVAAQIGKLLGSAVDERVVDGEAGAYMFAQIESTKTALREAWKALRGHESSKWIDVPYPQAMSSATFSRELMHNALEAEKFRQSGLGHAIDFLGGFTRTPGNFLNAQDAFFKTVAFSGEVAAQAKRQATREGLTGKAMKQRVVELIQNPPEHIKLAASDHAAYATFTNAPGEWTQKIMQARNAGSLNPTFMFVPFIRTPANILHYTFERSPLAPLMQSFRDDISAGGSRAHLAMARMGVGTMVLATALDYADMGLITGKGPTDRADNQALRATGWKPYSIRVGDTYWPIHRADPIATPFMFAAEITERLRGTHLSPEDHDLAQSTMAHAVGALSSSVIDKSYFQGIGDFEKMLQEAARGNTTAVDNYFKRMAASSLPFESLLRQGKMFVDPVTRDPSTYWDHIRAQIPGWSDKVPPLRDVWGRKVQPQEIYGRIFDAISPSVPSKTVDSPIDHELVRLDKGKLRVNKTAQFQGVRINFRYHPEVYDRYVQLAGGAGDPDKDGQPTGFRPNAPGKDWHGLTLKEYLDAVVGGNSPSSADYQMQSDYHKGQFIDQTVARYRQMAQQQLMEEARTKWPEFYDLVNAKRMSRSETRERAPGAQRMETIPQPRLPAPTPRDRPPSGTGLQAR